MVLQALEDDIATLSSNLASVEKTCGGLENGSPPATAGSCEGVSAALRQEAHHTAQRLRSDWDTIVAKTRLLNDKLIEAVQSKEEASHREWTAWYEGVTVPAGEGIETSGDLQAAVSQCQDILQELDSRKSLIDSSLPPENLGRPEVEKQANDLKQRLDDRLSSLQSALQHYSLFKELCSVESNWLRQLEEKLALWSAPAADAEEITAKQDELECFLRRGEEEAPTRARLDEAAQSLLQLQVMTVAVQNTKHSLESQRKELIAKSEAVQQSLEKASVRSQESEQQYLTLLERITALHKLLPLVDADQQTVAQVKQEIRVHGDTLQKLRDEVQLYREEGNVPAAERLAQQLHLLESKYEEVASQLRADGVLLQSSSSSAHLSVSSPVVPRAAQNTANDG